MSDDMDYEHLKRDAALGRQVRQLPEGWLLSNNGDDLNYEGLWDVRDPKGAPPPKGNAFIRGIGETPEDALTMAGIVGDVQKRDKTRQALQAIADAEPAANTRAYDERCDGCKELIAMAREGVDGEPATIGESESEVVTVEPTRLTTEEVFERVKALEYFAEVTIEQGRVAFLKQLWCHEDEEVHDAVRHCCYDLQEILEGVGLRAVEIGSDNDSVWGVIEEAQP